MTKSERVNQIYDLLSAAWGIAYDLEKETEGKESQLFDDMNMIINKAKCKRHEWDEMFNGETK